MKDYSDDGVKQQFDQLLNTLPDAEVLQILRCRHTRAEIVHGGQEFVLYRVTGSGTTVLDRLVILDVEASVDDGLRMVAKLHSSSDEILVGYLPKRIGEHSIYLHIPLRPKLRWDDARGLEFPLVIRVKSRLHMFERGVTYFETLDTFNAVNSQTVEA